MSKPRWGGEPASTAPLQSPKPRFTGVLAREQTTTTKSNWSPRTAQAKSIHKYAQMLGIDSVDLATAIAFETIGKFSTSIKGPITHRGQHIGLIQFGETEQKMYGAAAGQTFDEQMGAVYRYLKHRGVKPGMGMLDVYSTINAGRPGLYHRSDTKAGGTKGNVRDKVNTQMGAYRKQAEAMFTATGAYDPWKPPKFKPQE